MQTQIIMRMRRKATAAQALERIIKAIEKDGATILRQSISPNGKGVRMTIERERGARDLLPIFEVYEHELIDASARAADASFFTFDAQACRACL